MDSVLSDFLTSAQTRLNGTSIEGLPSPKLFAVCCGVDFWANLQPFSWTFDLIKVVEKYDKNWSFLTKSTIHDPMCMSGKAVWVKKHFPHKSRNLICVNDKKDLIGNVGRFLIDDLEENCTSWHKAGGSFYQWTPVRESPASYINEALLSLESKLNNFYERV